jgi:hypothetical protein
MADAIPCKHCGHYQTDHEIDFSVSDDEAKMILSGFTSPLVGEDEVCIYAPLFSKQDEIMMPTPSFPGGH